MDFMGPAKGLARIALQSWTSRRVGMCPSCARSRASMGLCMSSPLMASQATASPVTCANSSNQTVSSCSLCAHAYGRLHPVRADCSLCRMRTYFPSQHSCQHYCSQLCTSVQRSPTSAARPAGQRRHHEEEGQRRQVHVGQHARGCGHPPQARPQRPDVRQRGGRRAARCIRRGQRRGKRRRGEPQPHCAACDQAQG